MNLKIASFYTIVGLYSTCVYMTIIAAYYFPNDKISNYFIKLTKHAYHSFLMIVFYMYLGSTQITVTGDYEKLLSEQRTIIISNHQMYLDWFYIWVIGK